jgi:hypothetical protein
MKYRVLQQEADSAVFELLREKDAVTDHAQALVTAENWVKGRSGRKAIVVADRDTFSSTTVTKHTPGTE